MKLIATILLSLMLTGCYETVNEKQSRENLEQRVKQLERDAARDPRCDSPARYQAMSEGANCS